MQKNTCNQMGDDLTSEQVSRLANLENQLAAIEGFDSEINQIDEICEEIAYLNQIKMMAAKIGTLEEIVSKLDERNEKSNAIIEALKFENEELEYKVLNANGGFN